MKLQGLEFSKSAFPCKAAFQIKTKKHGTVTWRQVRAVGWVGQEELRFHVRILIVALALRSAALCLVVVAGHCRLHHCSAAGYPTLSDTVLPQHHFNLPSIPISSPLDSEYFACVRVCEQLYAIGFARACVCVFCLYVCLLDVMRIMLNEVL